MSLKIILEGSLTVIEDRPDGKRRLIHDPVSQVTAVLTSIHGRELGLDVLVENGRFTQSWEVDSFDVLTKGESGL